MKSEVTDVSLLLSCYKLLITDTSAGNCRQLAVKHIIIKERPSYKLMSHKYLLLFATPATVARLQEELVP